MLKSGDILLSRYRIVRPIARGGMGAVYEARDERLKRSIALKETLIKEDDLPHAFQHEATLLANLSHPALPKVFDHFAENDGQYIIMEFIPGDDLEKLLGKRGQPFSVAEIESWYDQLLDALEYLHSHTIIHRDLKPSNLKVKNNGGVILLDFGLAKGTAGQMTHQAVNRSVLGYTPIYAPLEQIRCEGTTPATDLYSLGATMYHLLTNIAPIDAQKRELNLLKIGSDPLQPLAKVRPDLPPQLAEMLTRALKLEAQERPESAAMMRGAVSDHARRTGPPPETLLNSDLERSLQPTLPIIAAPRPQPKPQIKRPVKLALAISVALTLSIFIWLATAYIFSHRANITPPPPSNVVLPLTAENRNLYGGIEIGSKGIKAIVLNVEAAEDGYKPDARMPLKTVNTTLMSGVAQTGKFSTEALDATAKEVKKLYTQMRDQYKVATERIRIIGSSGLKKPDKSEVDNRDELVKRIESATGGKMSFLDAEQEVRLSVSGIIPTKYLRTAILIDIGSGNTKGGYQEGYQGDDHFVTINIPYGTVSFTDEVNKQAATTGDFAGQAEKLRREQLLPTLQHEVERKPGLVNRHRAYLSGGIVWAMANLLHPANREANIEITPQDITTFATLASNGDQSLLNPTLSGIKDEKTRHEVEEEIQRINETFTPQNLIAGAQLLQSVYIGFKLANKEVYFSRYGSMGWLLQYVQSQATEKQENTEK
jgi:serine/threonine protein kinase